MIKLDLDVQYGDLRFDNSSKFFKDIFHALLNPAVTVLLEYLPTNYNCSGFL